MRKRQPEECHHVCLYCDKFHSHFVSEGTPMDFYSMYCIDCAWNAYKRLRAVGFHNDTQRSIWQGRQNSNKAASGDLQKDSPENIPNRLENEQSEHDEGQSAWRTTNRFALAAENSPALGRSGGLLALACESADEEFEMSIFLQGN